MNAFQRKMAEQMALIGTLVMDINNRADDLDIRMHFSGHVNKLDIDFNHLQGQKGKFKAGNKEFWNTFSLNAYIEEEQQELPYEGCCTMEQITHVLHQIRQALIEGRTDHESHKHTATTNSQHPATTGMDERNGTNGSFLTPAASLCHGSVKGTGGQPSGAVSSMA